MDENRITYFAETDFRGKRIKFGIRAKDRSRHMYVIGKTGMGKSTLLENMAIQDIQNGEGFAFVDPHGKSADLLLDYIPDERKEDVLYFAPFDLEYPVAFNIMEDVGYEKRHLVVSGLISAFKKIWPDVWSSRMEYILSNTIFALLEYPGATLLGVNRMLIDKEYRKRVVDNIKDPLVRSFWVDEFAKYTDRYTQEATPAIQNKIGQFTANPVIRNIIGQPHSRFDIRNFMDNKKIIILNLSKGRIGETNANLLGSMFITKIYLAAMSRADVSDSELHHLPSFYLYVDEFQSFANESFADVLSEARKYKLSLTLAHQYIEQMSDEVRAAVFGNVGTLVAFRVGAYDAEVLEKEFAPVFTKEDLVNLGFAQIYLRLMINGVSSKPFSAHTILPPAPPSESLRDVVIEASRRLFTMPRHVVEERIDRWYQEGRVEETQTKKDHKKTSSLQKREAAIMRDKAAENLHDNKVKETIKKKSIKGLNKQATPSGVRRVKKEIEVSGAGNKDESTDIISLDELRKKNKEKRHAPRERDLKELREVLSSVLESKDTSSVDEGVKKSSSTPQKKIGGENKVGRVSSPQRSQKALPEIAEDDLRRLLSVDIEDV